MCVSHRNEKGNGKESRRERRKKRRRKKKIGRFGQVKGMFPNSLGNRRPPPSLLVHHSSRLETPEL
jgi:hypothetical protein